MTRSRVASDTNSFSDPQTWKENNPYRRSVVTPSRGSSNSSPVRQPHRPRPAHRRSASASDASRQVPVEAKRPSRSRSVRHRSHIPGPDPVDRMAMILDVPYHHDGPFEATLAARQIPGRAPVDALKTSNAETLKATPRWNLIDSLEKHYPLQGTATIAPGVGDMPEYEEYDVQTQDGGYKRWPGMEYLDKDFKGKGEPSYTIEEFEKQQKASRRKLKGNDNSGYKMRDMPLDPDLRRTRTARSTDSTADPSPGPGSGNPGRSSLGRRSSAAGRLESLGGKLKKTFLLRRKKD